MSVLRNQKNSKHQGNVGLGAAIAWFEENDFRISIPLTDSQDYDLIVDDGNRLYKVQVRTTYHLAYEKIYQVHLKVNGGNRSGVGKVKRLVETDVDLLFVLTETGEQFLIPCSEITARNHINLGDGYQKYKVS
jgi:hypothetical protein